LTIFFRGIYSISTIAVGLEREPTISFRNRRDSLLICYSFIPLFNFFFTSM